MQPGLQPGLQLVTQSQSPVAGGQQCRGAAGEGEVPPFQEASQHSGGNNTTADKGQFCKR